MQFEPFEHFKPNITNIVKVKDNTFLISAEGGGIKEVKISFSNYKQSIGSRVYCKKQTIGFMVVVGKEKVLVGSYSMSNYFLLDLKQQSEELIVEGFSSCCSIKLFPNFNVDSFPLLTKEKTNVCVLNLKQKRIFKIANI